MVDHPLEPEELTAAGLPSARRGYDRKAVVALLGEASRRWQELRDRHDSVIGEIEQRGGIENLGRDLREVGQRVTTILGEAQAAGDDLRSHAVEEAQARIDGAIAHADGLVAEADDEAFDLRKDAWETGTDLLGKVQHTIDAMIEEAESDTLIIRAKAEQDAHRHLTDSRKEAGDITRNARFEAERLVGEAKRRADELLADAAQAGAAAGARAQPRGDWGVTVIDSEGVRRGGDPAVEIDPHHPAYGDVLAAEVGSLRGRPDDAPPPPPPEQDPTPVAESEPEPAVSGSEPDPEPASEPEAIAEPESVQAEEVGEDEVGGLFDRLRRTDEIPVVAIKPQPDPQPEPDLQPEPDPVPEPEQEPPGAPLVRGPDAIEVRERLLLPLLNEYVRIARSELLETQNVALDEIRTLRRGSSWKPTTEAIGGGLRDVIAPLAAASVEAGGRGATDLGASASDEPVSDARALEFIDDLVEALAAAVSGAATAEDPGSEVARVFRSWRNDEVERWVRTAGFAGYHDGVVAGLAGSGIAEIVGVRHGRLCKQCPAAAGVVWDPAGQPPEGYDSPPTQLDCACAVEPHV